MSELVTVIVDENSHRADVLYVWLSADANGNEGIIATQGNMGWVPMVFCVPDIARQQEPAVRAVTETLRAHGQKTTARLVKFTRGETLKEL